MNTISLIVPCYNEEDTLQLFFEAVESQQKQLNDAVFEYIFVDDGSKDRTYELLLKMSDAHENIKYISFSRNFGKEAAIFSGLRSATGDCCIVMDADLQHPPETILSMYEKWLEGYEVVEGIKTDRGRENFIHKAFANTFYFFISKAIGFDMKNSSDFKLLDRKVVAELCKLHERDTFFRALSWWVGFKQTTIEYEVQERVAGTSKWSFGSLVKYAIRNLLSFTYAPLKLITILGTFVMLVGCGFAVDALISYIQHDTVSGYPTLLLVILLTTGAIMCSLGIIGTYIAKIYEELKGRPQYIVRDKSHVKKDTDHNRED